MFFKSYTDNSLASSTPQAAGPRLFFTSAFGKSTDFEFGTYPRANQELGRVAFWGTSGDNTSPSSILPPAFLSVQARDDWDASGTGSTKATPGNTDVYLMSTSNKNTGASGHMAIQGGRLTLSSGNDTTIDFVPAQSSGTTPSSLYQGDYAKFAELGYNSGTTGSKLKITNGGSSGAGVVGDVVLNINRNDISDGGANTTVQNGNSGANIFRKGLSGLPADTISFSGSVPSGLSDGDPMIISGFSSTFGTAYNGTVVFAKIVTATGVSLFPTAADAIAGTNGLDNGPYPFGSGFADLAGATGSVEFTLAPSVTDRDWQFILAEQSNDLELKTIDDSSTSTSVVVYKENQILQKQNVRTQITDFTTTTSGNTVSLTSTTLNASKLDIATSGAGTVTIDVAALGVADTGGQWHMEITNSSGAAQTVATTNAVTNVSQSVADSAKILLRFYTVGTTVYADFIT